MIRLNGIAVNYSNFSAGEVHVDLSKQFDLSSLERDDIAHMDLSFRSNDDIFALMLMVDAYRKINKHAELRLTIGYLPYGRQDRTTSPGTSFALRTLAKMLNMCGFASVTVRDAHNPAVCEALIVNFVNIEQCDILFQPALSILCANPGSFIVVAPDEGAIKKSYKLFEKMNVEAMVSGTFVSASKTRNPRTGEITGMVVPDFSHSTVQCPIFIFDDIIDGGRTFIELAKVIAPRMGVKSSIHLLATVGIFSKGRAVVEAEFDSVTVDIDFTKKELK